MPEWLRTVREWAGQPVGGSPLYDYPLALAIVAASWYVKRFLSWIFTHILRRITARAKSKVEDSVMTAAERPIAWLAVVAGVLAAMKVLHIYTEHEHFYEKFASISMAVLAVVFLLRLIDGLAHNFMPKGAAESGLDNSVMPAVRGTAKIFVVTVAALWIMSAPLGYDVKAILAGLGVGGLAVALAAQGTLANWFGAYMIFSDRPFSVGDFIQIDSFSGSVEQVGLRSTRIRTIDGAVVTIPNSAVASAKISNMSKAPAQRYWGQVSLARDTRPEKIREAVAMIKDILRNEADAGKDFFVCFEEIGDYSLNIRVNWNSATPDWNAYMAARERINLAIMEQLAAAGIALSLPSREVHVKEDCAGKAAAGGA